MNLEINQEVAKQFQADLKANTGGGGMFFGHKQIGERTPVRILPGPESNGYWPAIMVISYWVNGQKYTCPTTFDKDAFSPLKENLENALASPDASVKALAGKVNKVQEWVCRALILNAVWGTDGTVTSLTVAGDKAKILTIGSGLSNKIFGKLYYDVQYQNGTSLGIFDLEQGYNINLSKTGSGQKTRYDAMPWRNQNPIPERYFTNAVDHVEFIRKGLKTDEELNDIMNNYLYGSGQQQSNQGPDLMNLANSTAKGGPMVGQIPAATMEAPVAPAPQIPVAPANPVIPQNNEIPVQTTENTGSLMDDINNM